jgi:hypothetical protein
MGTAIGQALTGVLKPEEVPPSLTVLTAAQALEPIAPVPAVIENLFARASLNALVSAPKNLKTFTTIDIAAAIATGREWLGLSTEHGAALIIDEENGGAVDRRRIGMTLRGWNAGAETPIYCASLPRLNFKLRPTCDLLQAFITANGVVFVAIDSWIDVLAVAGANENDSSETQAIAMNLRDIAEDTGAAMLLLHHENRAGSYRGSSSLPGVVDTMLRLKRDGNLLTFHVEYTRQFEAPADFSALANFTPEAFNLSPTETMADTPHYSKAQAFVLRYLDAHGSTEITEMCSHADTCSASQARNAVYSLAAMNLVRRVDGGGQGVKAVYALRNGSS